MQLKTPGIEAAARRLLARITVNPISGCWMSPSRSQMTWVKDSNPMQAHLVLWVDRHGFTQPNSTLVRTCSTQGCINPEHRRERVNPT